MKNMIEQIVEMDQQAQQITADAQRRKVQSGQEIQQLREKIQEEYLQRARKRLKTNEEIEREAAKTAFLQVEARYQKISSDMETLYESKKDEWADAIVKRVIGE